ncbi:MAG: DegV family protein [Lachnospiraceae bacterium]|nr:DegV family protein [Lachnospiraceae bacterium]
MSYKIVIDSCGELTEELKRDGHYESVPLEIFVDDYHIVDDETFDQAEFLRRVAASPNCPKSTCPSPERYVEAFDCEAEHIYGVTLSSQLSGSYNSAELGKKLYLEEKGDKKIHIFDSRSASVGETLVGMKIQEYEEAGLPFEEVIEKVEAFIAEKNTSFVLETLETLRKNGRLSNIKAFVANTLNIKPVMAGSREGTIYQLGQARGITKAVDKMIKDLVAKTANPREKILAISHCNCPERAKAAVEKIKQMAEFKRIIVVETAGISSMYASDGGIIMVV